MFTGIIEGLGTIESIEREGTNIHFKVASPLSKELKIDQSISHDGVCLTVVACDENSHTVTAIEETLKLTNLGEWEVGKPVNLERAMTYGSRLDGHLIQGHVDTVATCYAVEEEDGSWYFRFNYTPASDEQLLVTKGSICINGVSLTVVEPTDNSFSVAIIPYTYEHTTFHKIAVGDKINLEFDILGKYMAKYAKLYAQQYLQNPVT